MSVAEDFCYPPGMISVDEAQVYVLERARPVASPETVSIEEARGRVLATPVVSPIDVPSYANSAMDGYAVRAEDTLTDSPSQVSLTVAQRVPAGMIPQAPLGAGQAARVFTGAALPAGANAVVIQEDCVRDGDQVSFAGPVPAGQFVRPLGNDIRAGTEILATGLRLGPQHLGLIASVGLPAVAVQRRLRVAVFSSGNELLLPGQPLVPGCIYNSNRYTLRALLESLGCEVVDLGIVEDTLAATEAALLEAAKVADLTVTSGGMSVGEEDHLKQALETVGRLEMWRVAVKPGKPLAYGRVLDADFLGLPGNPVSTFVTFCLFVRPFIFKRLGVRDPLPRAWRVEAGFSWPRPAARREFARARLESLEGGTYVAELYAKQGSDVLTSAVWADGLVEIPEGRTVAPGDPVAYYSFESLTT